MQESLIVSKRYESTEVDRRTWLHMPSGTPWSTSSDTHQEVEKTTLNSKRHGSLMYIYRLLDYQSAINILISKRNSQPLCINCNKKMIDDSYASF